MTSSLNESSRGIAPSLFALFQYNGLPLMEFEDGVGLIEWATERVLSRLQSIYSVHQPLSSLNEAAAFAQINNILDNCFDVVDMSDVEVLVKFVKANFMKSTLSHWRSLSNLITMWKHDYKFLTSHHVFSNNQIEDGPIPYFSNFPFPLELQSDLSSGSICVDEIERVALFTNNFCIKSVQYNPEDINETVIAEIDHSFLLLQSGDVETNPGPTHSKFCNEEKDREQRRTIAMLQRQVAQMRKQEEKRQKHLQRALEMEKRDRNRNRKEDAYAKRHAQGLTDFFENVGTVADDMANGIGPALDLLRDALQKVNAAGDKIKSLFDLPENFDAYGTLVLLISICQSLFNKQFFVLSMQITQLARTLGVSFDKLMSLVPTLSSTSVVYATPQPSQGAPQQNASPPSTSTPHAQSLISDMFSTATKNPQLLPFTTVASFIVGVFNLSCSGKLPSPSEMLKHFANVGRAAQGMRAFKDFFKWIGDYCLEIYYTTVYGVSKVDYDFLKEYPRLESLYAAGKIVRDLQERTVHASSDIAEQILCMNCELQDYAVLAAKSQNRNHITLVENIRKTIKEAVEWARLSPARANTIRSEPVVCYLYGLPGIGKSVATQVLKSRIFKEFLSHRKYKLEESTFSRKSKNEYWEGYTGQPIVEIDDFGNVKDSVQKPVEEYTEFQYMVNTAQYPLNMAELSRKGTTNFTSEYILMSSNQKFPDVQHMVDPGAIYRRMHVCAEVTIDPKYGRASGVDKDGNTYYQFDAPTAANHLNVPLTSLSPLLTEHYTFKVYSVLYDYKTKQARVVKGKQDMSFEEFWKHFVDCAKSRRHKSDSLAKALRAEAGVTEEDTTAHEKEVLRKLKACFSAETLLDKIAESEDESLFGNLFNEVEEEKCDLFGLNSLSTNFSKAKKYLSSRFSDGITYFRNAVAKFWNSVKDIGSAVKNKLRSFANFILSFFLGGEIQDGELCVDSLDLQTNGFAPGSLVPYDDVVASEGYWRQFKFKLTRIPWFLVLKVLAKVLGISIGLWYAGMFQLGADLLGCCAFSKHPTRGTTPCKSCTACKIVDYPDQGDMLRHFLDRVGVKQVREGLYQVGWSPSSLSSVTHFLWTQLLRDTEESARKEVMEAMLNNPYRLESDDVGLLVAESRVYDTQPSVPRTRTLAQRVYDQNVRQPNPKPFAQNQTTGRLERGFVEAQTEMHIGARCYAQRDQVQVEQTTQVLLNNSVWIQAVDEDGMASRSNGVFLVGRTMLTTAHTVLNPPQDKPIVQLIIRNPYSAQANIMVPYDQCKITQLTQLDGSKLDLALVSFPPVVPNRPKILSKFIDANNIGLLGEGSMVFSGFYEVNGRTIVQEKYPSQFHVSTKTTSYYLHAPGKCPHDPESCQCPIEISNHVEYDLETSRGMCGALLSISNNLIHTKLIGFHVAGGAGVLALGAVTTRQLLEQNLRRHVSMFNIPDTYLIDGRLPYQQSFVDTSNVANLVQEGDCISVGKAIPVASPTQTQLSPSLVFDKVQSHTTKPAFLKPVMLGGVLVNPMVKGIKKVLGPQQWIDPTLLDIAANDVFQRIGFPSSGKGLIHSFEEAITGVENDPYKRPVNRKTSPGYPYNLNNKQKGKTFWLGSGEEYIVDNKELRADYDQLLQEARSGIRGNAISIATLKDEKRPIAKVDAGKTRVFEACPMHLVLAIRSMFLDFAAHIMRHRIDNGIAVGINPYSLEWTKLAHHLLSKGDNMVAGDFSNYDGSLTLQVMTKIVEKINEWYNDGQENALVRATLWEHICNADVLVGKDVIRQTHSQPSGNPLTVIVNSIFSAIVMRIAYLSLKKEQGLPSVCDYTKYVAEIVYGDDDVKSIHSNIIGWFNQQSITSALANIGLTYTDESKTDTVRPCKPLSETTFLKRYFVIQDDGLYMAPMAVENVLETANWIKGKAKRLATLENCEQCIMELSLHPKPEYDYWSTRIRDECARQGLKLMVPTWFEQRELLRYNRDGFARSEYSPLW